MTMDERFWWTVLLRATEQETTECCRTPRDMDAWDLARRVGLLARRELVKQGVDLDVVMLPADEEFLRLCRAEKKAAAERKEVPVSFVADDGSVEIPAHVREALRIESGQFVYFVSDNGGFFRFVSADQMRRALGEE